jgi:hypothetical protein
MGLKAVMSLSECWILARNTAPEAGKGIWLFTRMKLETMIIKRAFFETPSPRSSHACSMSQAALTWPNAPGVRVSQYTNSRYPNPVHPIAVI